MDKTIPSQRTPSPFRVARDTFQGRREAELALIDQAEAIALACHDMARRFHRGGKLIAFGNGTSSTDAQHIAVEFVHPVMVGKRALPAISLTNDSATLTSLATHQNWDEVFAHQLRYLAHPQDIAIGLSLDDRCQNVRRGLEVAKERGLLTLALTTRDSGCITQSAAVDHLLAVASAHPHIVREMHITLYHILWELVHVFFEHPGLFEGVKQSSEPTRHQVEEIETLYPSLYGMPSHLTEILQAVQRSTVMKIQEIGTLREQVTDDLWRRLSECATAMARAFMGQGRLFAFGNGGSATDAQALAQLFLSPAAGQPLPALALTNDVAVVTALANDVGFDIVFARQIAAFGMAGDIAIGLSTSGNSENIIRAFDEAAQRGLLTIGFAGYDGGQMAEAGSIAHLFVVPSASVHRIQEAQATLYQALWELTQEALQGAQIPLERQSAAR
jgi:D-sedoheptulose 7-phosphate isomerase